MNEQHSNLAGPRQATPQSLEQALGLIEALQEQLDSVRDQLAWANRLDTLGTLTAGLAHEFNNLLTPIGSYAQLALAHPEKSELTEKALKAAATGSAQAGRLIEMVLGLASPEPTNNAACRLDDVVDNTLQCLGVALQRAGVHVERDTPEITLKIDGLALQQVLINLINNAIHAMADQAKGKRIGIKAQAEPDHALIELTDSGPGIDQTMQAHLFEPFTTGHTNSATGYTDDPRKSGPPQASPPGGSGLGLSICKDLVESAGGSISVQSTPGRGASFRIKLTIA